MIRLRSQGWRALLAEEPFARRFCKRLTPCPDDVEEWIQDAWVAALEHPPRSLDPRVIRSWWATVLWRTAHARRSRRTPEGLADASDVPDLRTDPGVLEGNDRRASRVRMLEEVLGDLPESSRALIRERHLDGRSPTEMARARGVAPEVLRNRLSRAMTHLRRRLEHRDRAEFEPDRRREPGAWFISLPGLRWLGKFPRPRALALAALPLVATLLVHLESRLLPDPAAPIGVTRIAEGTDSAQVPSTLDRDAPARSPAFPGIGMPSAPLEASRSDSDSSPRIHLGAIDFEESMPLREARYGRVDVRARTRIALESMDVDALDRVPFGEIFGHLESPDSEPLELGSASPMGSFSVGEDELGESALWISHPGFATGYVPAAGLRDRISIALQRTAEVRGRVVDEAGRPRAGIELELRFQAEPLVNRWFEGGREVVLARPLMAPGLGLDPVVRTDRDGRVTLTGLPRGRVLSLRPVGSAAGTPPWRVEVPRSPAATGPGELTWTLPEAARLELLHANPKTRALSWSWYPGGSPLPIPGDPRGRVTEFADLPSGRGTLVGTHSRAKGFEVLYREAHVLEPGARERIPLDGLPPRHALQGSVQIPGEIPPGESIHVKVHGGGFLVAEQRLESPGAFDFRIPGTTVEVELALGDRPLVRTEVELPNRSLVFDLDERLGTLGFRLPPDWRGARSSREWTPSLHLLLEYDDGRRVHGRCGIPPGGDRGQLPAIPPGRFTVYASGGSLGIARSRPTRVHGGERVEAFLESVPGGQLRGRVHDPSGRPPTAASVRLWNHRSHFGGPWAERRLRLDNKGDYRAPGLGAGTWFAEAELEGRRARVEFEVGSSGAHPWIAPPLVLPSVGAARPPGSGAVPGLTPARSASHPTPSVGSTPKGR